MDALGAMLAAGVAPAKGDRPPASAPAAPGRGADNAKAAKEMEALFVVQLLKAMRKTVPESGLLTGGRGEEIMRSIQDESLAQAVAARGGLGLAETLERTLDRVHPEPENAPGPGTGKDP
jgi:flagellar protein FlgJ